MSHPVRAIASKSILSAAPEHPVSHAPDPTGEAAGRTRSAVDPANCADRDAAGSIDRRKQARGLRRVGRPRGRARLLGLATLAMIAMIASAPSAPAQEDPSFDCAKASTAVETALCAGGNSGMGWLDQTMADLYQAARRAPGVDPAALRASQRAWLATRDRCSGDQDAMLTCLTNAYRVRFAAIADRFDDGALTGVYRAPEIGGELDAVRFPDGDVAVNITSTLSPPTYNQCRVAFRAPVAKDSLRYTPAPEENIADDDCTLVLEISDGALIVQGCAQFCGNGATLDATYVR